MKIKTPAIFGFSVLLLLLSTIGSILYGHNIYSLQSLGEVMFAFDAENRMHQIITNLRIPRTVMAIVVGACLGLSGVLVQSLMNNPMASPCLFGINAGASLGIVLNLFFTNTTSSGGIFVSSLMGSACAAILILFASYLCKNDPVRVTLVGVIFTSFIASLTIMAIIGNGGDPQEALMWITGSFVDKQIANSGILVFLGICVFMTILISGQINTFILGRDIAKTLGQNIFFWKSIFTVLIIIFAGLSVAMAGAIGFLGLLIPHLTKRIIGPNYRLIVPFSTIFGAIFLLLADIFTRAISLNIDLPIGLTMSVIGAPFLLYLARRKRLAC
ncbi:MAG: FecCD family ABC transporter permease [Spirochaetia bacterium]